MRTTTLYGALLAALTFAGAWSAQADETLPATDFDGTYAIGYDAVGFNLHLCVNGQCMVAQWPGLGDMITPADRELFRAELEVACLDAVDPWICDLLVDPVVDLVAGYVVATANQLPETVDLVVDPDPVMFLWWSTGLHGFDADVSSALYDPVTLEPTGDVAESSFGGLFDNNDGANHGNYVSIGLAVGQPGAAEGIACVPLAAAALGGTIHRDQGFDLDGSFGADVELVCLLSDGVHLGLVNLGLTEAATFTGARE